MIKLYCLQDFAPKLYCLQVLRSSRVNVGFTLLLITQEFRCFKISELCYICLTGARLWPKYPCAPALANKQLVWDSNSPTHCLQLLVSLCFICSLSYFFVFFHISLFPFHISLFSFIFLYFPFIVLSFLWFNATYYFSIYIAFRKL